jgi:hypothetical protein
LELAKDAQALGRGWSIGYYCSGFAVELMLKAIYLRQQKLGAWPAEMRGSKWHEIQRLADACGLLQQARDEAHRSKPFARHWAMVKDWSSERRYPQASVDRDEASNILNAVSDPERGVLKWLASHYARL